MRDEQPKAVIPSGSRDPRLQRADPWITRSSTSIRKICDLQEVLMELDLGGVVIVPLIVGLVEAAKRLGLSAQYAALLALAIGIAISVGGWLTVRAGGRDLFDATLVGLALGLSASGLYSVARATGLRPER